MKNVVVNLAITATLAVGATANPHNHMHHHHLVKKRGDGVLARDAVKTVTEQAMATQYIMDGKPVPVDDAKFGIDHGKYIVVGSSYMTPTPEPKAAPVVVSVEVPPIEDAAPTDYPEQIQSSEPAPSPSSPAAVLPGVGVGGGDGYAGIDSEFPDDQLPCDFSSVEKYGAISLDWLGTGGWSGIQKTPNYHEGDASIDYIVTGEKGDKCDPGSFCSYACPIGYQKIQWPEAQGSTLQSIGGLYCSLDGKLRLTRPEKKTLCGKGVGGVTLRNDLDDNVVTCRTDYPGTESPVVPIISQPGSELPVTNPDSTDYYRWNGASTTAQYYTNKKGYGVEDSCLWTSPIDPDGAGNFSPMNIGVGCNEEGITYLSIFLNKPSSSAILDFNIEITGDVSIKCSYIDGKFSNPSLDGCTTAVKAGGNAMIRYY